MKKVTAAVWAGVLLLSACSSEETKEENAGENQDQEQAATSDDSGSSSSEEEKEGNQDSSASEEEESQGESVPEDQDHRSSSSTENDTEREGEPRSTDPQEEQEPITEGDVPELVFAYIREHEDFDAEEVQVIAETRENGDYRAQVFQSVPAEANQQATQTLRWYTIDQRSGKIQQATPGMETNSEIAPEPTMSGIVSMSEEERNAHYRRLAAAEEHLQERVLDQLLLPGVHENTVSYGGRVGQGDTVQWEFPDAESRADRTTINVDVGEEGYFQLNLAPYEFSAGETMTVRISGDYPQEQVFELPVYEREEGKEILQVQ